MLHDICCGKLGNLCIQRTFISHGIAHGGNKKKTDDPKRRENVNEEEFASIRYIHDLRIPTKSGNIFTKYLWISVYSTTSDTIFLRRKVKKSKRI